MFIVVNISRFIFVVAGMYENILTTKFPPFTVFFPLICAVLVGGANRGFQDTPPGTSDEHLTVVRMLMGARPEGAVIVSTPQELSLTTVRKEVDFCRKLGLPVAGLVSNMAAFICPCCQVN